MFKNKIAFITYLEIRQLVNIGFFALKELEYNKTTPYMRISLKINLVTMLTT